MTCWPAALSVRNGLYANVIPFDQMQTVTLETALPKIGLKTNGFAVGDTLRGNFRLDQWGTTRLYINLDVPPFVVIRAKDGYVVFNFKDAERTRALYGDLTSRIDRRGK